MSLTGTDSPGTASKLLDLNYWSVSVLMVWVYEYAITFDEEVAFLKKSKWNIVKIFYLVCRYLPFLLVTISTSRFLQPGLSLKACQSYVQFILFTSAIIIVCAERKRTPGPLTPLALIIILVNFMVFFIPIIVIVAFFSSAPTVTTVPVPGITSCSSASPNRIIIWTCVLLVIGETEILLSTLYRSLQHYREVGSRSRLLTILVNHNVWYFGCSLTSSVAVIFMMTFLPSPYNDFLAGPQLSDDPTGDTGHSDAPFPVELGTEEESTKSG
ncbi:hypothetical protein BU15DRAFT_81509 [Melanogaster broomeanus]|nr:hypothetical protein BU15DRAFT_81509 [Melanogaster broomeanus]